MVEFLEKYLKEIKDISPLDKEYTYRKALHTLIESIINQDAPLLTIKHEPNNDKEGRGAPDFVILNQGLSIGYIENKRVDADLDSVAQSPQIAKYLSLSDNIVLTDYLRFCLVRGDERGKIATIMECRICELNQIKSALKNKPILESKAKELLEFFELFCTHQAKPINTALEFANTLARRTRILKEEILKNVANENIQHLYHTFTKSLYEELEFKIFADSFAQTLTYSLFLSRLNNTGNQEIDLFNVKKFIPKSFPLIRAMSGFLDNLDDLDSIKWLLEEIIYINNHIDIASIIFQLNQASEKDVFGQYSIHFTHKDPYLHFYETFLSQYDPNLREVRGVYYTPASIVCFIMNAIDDILKKDFSLKNGLGAALEKDITLLDFATGTGTFLLEAFRKALESVPKNSPRYAPKKLLHKFFGFEFLIAPYTIAHLKLSQSFKNEFEAPLIDNENINIRLTNTLYFKSKALEEWDRAMQGIDSELTNEARIAQKIKESQILIITGNPPYSGASANKGLFENEIRMRYKNVLNYSPLALYRNGKLEKEKNPKMLLDDYVKFICFAESKIKEQNSGIFAFISNNAFLDNPTFRGMRHSLLKTFDRIYIIDLHGSTRKKEYAPDGSKDENVFDIMQGVSINIFIKSADTKNCHDKTLSKETIVDSKKDVSASPQYDNLASLYHYDLYGKRKDKYNFLYDNTLESIKWNLLQPKEPFYLFIPQNNNIQVEYDKFWSLKDIFMLLNTGFVTKRDKLCIQKTKEKMWETMQDILNLEKDKFYLKYKLPSDVRDWRYEWAKEDILHNNSKDKIQKIVYRPFDIRYVFYSGKSRGFIGWPVPIVSEHFLYREHNIGLVFDRSCKFQEVDSFFVSTYILDKHLVGSASYVSPLYLYPTESACKIVQKSLKGFYKNDKPNPFENKEKIENFAPNFRAFINKKYKEYFTPEQILGYIYAILFHKGYREKYINFLKIDFPKIPFVESKKIFLQLSTLGQELIKTHVLQNAKIDSIIGEALYRNINNKNLIIEKITHHPKEQKLFVNSSLYFDKVSQPVWEYRIGSYQVLDKYLKSHKNEEIDYQHFSRVIQALHKSLEIEEEISRINISL